MKRRDIVHGLVRVLLQEEKIRLVLRVRLKHIRPAIAALGHMMRKTRYHYAWYATHAPIVYREKHEKPI